VTGSAFIASGEIDDATVVQRGDHVGMVEVDGCLVLVDEFAGRGFGLNSEASLIWRCLDGAAPLDEVIRDLSHVFDVDDKVMRDDVVATVRDFGSLGLLEGVAMHIESMPIEIRYIGEPDDCAQPVGTEQPRPAFDERYVTVPPNY
jgi:hypothetical protein